VADSRSVTRCAPIYAQTLLWFLAGNIALLSADAYCYILAAGGAPWTAAWLFAQLALLSQIGIVTLVTGLALLLVCHIGRAWWFLALLAPAAVTLLNLYVYLDRSIYAFYRFHLGGLELHALTLPGGLAALRVEPSEPSLFVAGITLLLLAEVLAFRVLCRHFAAHAVDGAAVRRRWLAFAGIVGLLAVADHVLYAASDLADVRNVLRAARLVPFYQPFTIERLARRHGETVAVASPSGPALPHYPRAPLRFEPSPRRPNILWVVIDSWRADTLNAENTPRIWNLAGRSQVFDEHMSGGNSTQYGTFSMFYGLWASAEPSFAAEHRGPVLFDALKELGYRIEVLSSLELSLADFRRALLVGVREDVTAVPGRRAADKDRQIRERFEALLPEQPDAPPFFTLAIMESTHAGYDLDEADAPYRPYARGIGVRGLGSGEFRLAVFNRYRNSVHYADRLVGEMVDALERRGLLANTIVLVTGDHGEEFDEHGYWGHNGALTPEQVHVPLVLYVPGTAGRHHHGLTSHLDLPATVLGLVGVTNPPSDYSLGRSLLATQADPYAITCTADECALIDGVQTVTFGVGARTSAGIEVMDADYHPIHTSAAGRAKRSMQVLTLLARESVFLK
jgi:uncharacterized protein